MDVWIIDLQSSAPEADLLLVLDEQETSRARRFHFAEHRRRFVVAHGVARFILASYLGISAPQVQYKRNTYGKPSLGNAVSPVFSLSHSSDIALLAVADEGEIGVDIERLRSLRQMDLAKRFFSAMEIDALERLDAEKQREGFFSCWTRKEAYVKAKGMGLSIPLNSFSVEANPQSTAALIESRFAPLDAECYQVWDMRLAEGYAAALAYLGDEIGPPRCRQWDSGSP